LHYYILRFILEVVGLSTPSSGRFNCRKFLTSIVWEIYADCFASLREKIII